MNFRRLLAATVALALVGSACSGSGAGQPTTTTSTPSASTSAQPEETPVGIEPWIAGYEIISELTPTESDCLVLGATSEAIGSPCIGMNPPMQFTVDGKVLVDVNNPGSSAVVINWQLEDLSAGGQMTFQWEAAQVRAVAMRELVEPQPVIQEGDVIVLDLVPCNWPGFPDGVDSLGRGTLGVFDTAVPTTQRPIMNVALTEGASFTTLDVDPEVRAVLVSKTAECLVS